MEGDGVEEDSREREDAVFHKYLFWGLGFLWTLKTRRRMARQLDFGKTRGGKVALCQDDIGQELVCHGL